jgi:hypothetical protein
LYLVAAALWQIGHAGEGGLYAEMIQDRSFDALAAATGFHASKENRLPLDLPLLAQHHRHPLQPLHAPWDNPTNKTYRSKQEWFEERRQDATFEPR